MRTTLDVAFDQTRRALQRAVIELGGVPCTVKPSALYSYYGGCVPTLAARAVNMLVGPRVFALDMLNATQYDRKARLFRCVRVGLVAVGGGVAEETNRRHGPECYCHGDRNEGTGDEESHVITQANASDCGVEYAYVFDIEQRRMLVLSSYSRDGSKMIGMFGSGDPDATWSVLAEVDLDAAPPRWDCMAA